MALRAGDLLRLIKQLLPRRRIPLMHHREQPIFLPRSGLRRRRSERCRAKG
jgi:hypothetical protein